MTINEIVLAAIPIILTALLGWISPYVVKWLDAKLGHEATLALTNFAYAAVQAAEQKAETITSPDKKLFAEAALKAFASDKKYKVSDSDIEVLIEAAVHQLKNGFGTLLSSATTVDGATTVAAVPVVQVPIAEPAPQPETVGVTGENPVPVEDVPNPVTDEVPPDQNPV